MRKEILVLLVLLSVFLAMGCTGNKSEAPNATVTPNTTVTPNATATSSAAGTETITVSAAASLTDAFKDIASQFEKENPGANVSFNFGSSGNLRMQIENDNTHLIDVFASADESQMNTLANESLIDNTSRKDFANNSLVLIVPADSTLNITSVNDLTDSKVQKISVGDPNAKVPVGIYTRTALNESGLWSQLENKMVFGGDVKQVLTYVERGEVDAGFVYATDVKTAEPGTIKTVANVSVSTPVTYPIAMVSSSEHKETAQKFIDFVTGEEGQAVLKEYGFVVKSQ